MQYESGCPERPGRLEEKAGPPPGCNVAWGAVLSSANPETQTEFIRSSSAEQPHRRTETCSISGELLCLPSQHPAWPHHNRSSSLPSPLRSPLYFAVTPHRPHLHHLEQMAAEGKTLGHETMRRCSPNTPETPQIWHKHTFNPEKTKSNVFIKKKKKSGVSCLTSSSAHTRKALRACTAADITPSTLSSRAKRSRKTRPASSSMDMTLPFRIDVCPPARVYRVMKMSDLKDIRRVPRRVCVYL